MLEQLNGFFRIVEQMSAVDTSGVEPLYTPLSAVQRCPPAAARRRRHRGRRARRQPAQRAGGGRRPVPRAEGDRMSGAELLHEPCGVGRRWRRPPLGAPRRACPSVERRATPPARTAWPPTSGSARCLARRRRSARSPRPRAADARRRRRRAPARCSACRSRTRTSSSPATLPTTAGSRCSPATAARSTPPSSPRLGAGRHGDARQAQLRRVRDGLEQRELGLRTVGAQPVGRSARAGRLVGRLGGGGGGAPAARGHRHRHRRLDPPAGELLRHHRHQADLRRVLALRHDRLRLQPRPGRPAGAQRRGLRPAAGGDERLRRARLDQRRAAAAGLPAALAAAREGATAAPAAAGPAHRPAEGVLPGRARRRRRGGAARRAGRARAARRHAGRRQPAAHRAVDSRSTTSSRRPRRRRTCRASTACATATAPSTTTTCWTCTRSQPQRRLRPRGQAPHHDRHLRALARLLRRLLPAGAEAAPHDRRRLPGVLPRSAT